MRKSFIIAVLLMSFTVSAVAQKRADVDAMANRNERLEFLLLDYKEELTKADRKISRLNSENTSLRKGITEILQKVDKSSMDIARLQNERNQLLTNKIALEETIKEREKTVNALEEINRKLKIDNAQLKATNNLLEQTVMVSDTIQKYQNRTIQQQKASISKLLDDYTNKCSEVTGEYNIPFSKESLQVILEGNNSSPNSSQIENLVVNICYQEDNENASERLLVYFTLYGNDRQVVRHSKLPVPKVSIDNAISYYEVEHHLKTSGKYKLEKDVTYYYELKYKERVIAKGIFTPS